MLIFSRVGVLLPASAVSESGMVLYLSTPSVRFKWLVPRLQLVSSATCLRLLAELQMDPPRRDHGLN